MNDPLIHNQDSHVLIVRPSMRDNCFTLILTSMWMKVHAWGLALATKYTSRIALDLTYFALSLGDIERCN